MASYLQWDGEDMFHHFCGSLEVAALQVLWDIGPHATTADVVCLSRQGLELRFKLSVLRQRYVQGGELLGESPAAVPRYYFVDW